MVIIIIKVANNDSNLARPLETLEFFRVKIAI
jgi:hypothetical protein